MGILRVCLMLIIFSCYGSSRQYRLKKNPAQDLHTFSSCFAGKGALLLSRFQSFEEFQRVVSIEYYGKPGSYSIEAPRDCMVKLTHRCGARMVSSELTDGVSQRDFQEAQKGSFWDKVSLVSRSPNVLWDKKNLERVYVLTKWRSDLFGEGDVAFFDLAEAMMYHISEEDRKHMSLQDLSDKGYINTFNHVTAQVFMTAVFSERLAAFVAEAHERYNMPELLSGKFSVEQLADIEYGPTDNYVDMINNEWGQELGNQLSQTYQIKRSTVWTPELLAAFLNDIQRYFSWSFQIGFTPFSPRDIVVLRFSDKLNKVLHSHMKLK